MSSAIDDRAVRLTYRGHCIWRLQSSAWSVPTLRGCVAHFGALVIAWLLVSPAAQAAGTLGFEERVACQATLEDIRWSEMIWPAQNPGTKPDRRSVLSDAQLRDKVDDQLRQESVLAEDYGQHIDAASLQRELDRMARQTLAPDRLARRFAALGNDAKRIAECLARPHLVQQRLRAAYAADPRQHGALRDKAEAVLAQGTSGNAVVASGGSERRVVYWRRGAKVDAALASDDRQSADLALDAEDFAARLARLKAVQTARGVAAASPYARSALREVDDAFVHETLLWHADDRFEVQVRSWPKRSHDQWWAERRLRAPRFDALPLDGLTLPAITGRRAEHAKAAGDSWQFIAQVVPNARSGHTAVWTGSEMIVWGGADFGEIRLDSGGRYSPATDSWGASTATSGAPSARRDHSAVWTGSEMIIWGGFDGSIVATGGRYDPLTDTWGAPIATAGAPAPRTVHTAVWTGSDMIVWGGAGSGLLNTGGRYDPDTDTWGVATATSGAPSARVGHSAVWANDQMIVWGGSDNVSGLLDGGARYDPTSNTWLGATASGGAPSARESHSAVWTGSQMIVWGGLDATGIHVNSGGRYDPAANAWLGATAVSGAPSARRLHSAIWTGGEMVVWGGFDGNDVLGTGGRYNPVSNAWGLPTSTSRPPGARFQHSAVWTGSEMIVWGGSIGAGSVNTGGRYDPSTNRWGAPTATSNAPAARDGHSAVWTGSGMIVWGGNRLGSSTATGHRYNPMTDAWGAATATIGAPTARTQQSAVWNGSEMVVWGGSDGTGMVNTGGRFNPTTDLWGAPTATNGAPDASEGHTAVWTGSEMIVWGGATNHGGRYDPVADAWGGTLSASGAPGARAYHRAIWTGREMIVWGGFNGAPVGTGGRYDPALDRWGTAIATGGAPAARYWHGAVWTGKAMIVWGGLTASTVLSDMWLYFPYATASLTTLTSLTPSPSDVGATVTARVRVASPDRAPVDGTVTVTASTGETCSDATPQPVDGLTVEYACGLSFATGGTRQIRASFSGSSSHDSSVSAPVLHVVGERIFESGFEGS
jgi:hypothetical protein